jgi:hypothetical protein
MSARLETQDENAIRALRGFGEVRRLMEIQRDAAWRELEDLKKAYGLVVSELDALRAEELRDARAGYGVPVLSEKKHGLRISARGVLGRVGGHLKFGAREMLRHLEELAERYYSGDCAVVDEFLQLYCLDDKRPTRDGGA